MTTFINYLKKIHRELYQENYNDINNSLVDYRLKDETEDSKYQPVYRFYQKLNKESIFINTLTTWPGQNHLSQYLKYQIESVSSKTGITKLDIIANYLEKTVTEIDRRKDIDDHFSTYNPGKLPILKKAKIILEKELSSIKENLVIEKNFLEALPEKFIQTENHEMNLEIKEITLESPKEDTSNLESFELKPIRKNNSPTLELKSEIVNKKRSKKNINDIYILLNSKYILSEIENYKIRVKICQEIKYILNKLGLIKHKDGKNILDILGDFFEIPIDIRVVLNLYANNAGNSSQKLTPTEYTLTAIYEIIVKNPDSLSKNISNIKMKEFEFNKETNEYSEVESNEYKLRTKLIIEIKLIMDLLEIVKNEEDEIILDRLADFLEIPISFRTLAYLFHNIDDNISRKLTPVEFKNTTIYKAIIGPSLKRVNKIKLNLKRKKDN